MSPKKKCSLNLEMTLYVWMLLMEPTCMIFNSLYTILVVDEYREGLPVGWMISNREDTIALNAFLTCVKLFVVILSLYGL